MRILYCELFLPSNLFFEYNDALDSYQMPAKWEAIRKYEFLQPVFQASNRRSFRTMHQQFFLLTVLHQLFSYIFLFQPIHDEFLHNRTVQHMDSPRCPSH